MREKNKWTLEQMPDQRGKIIIVTGANSGIGYAAVRALAAKGATVIMACRSLDKAAAAADKIKAANSKGHVILRQLDLADLSLVQTFADEFRSEFDHLDILINNAGVMAIPYRKTSDGFEMQFGTNHLGHFKLTALLYDMLAKIPNARVVTVSSYAHILGWINFNNLNGEKYYQKWLAYGQSKLANLLFGYELQRRVAKNGSGPISVVVHPGWAATNLQHSSWFFRVLNPFLAQSQEMGALPTLYAATSPDIRGGEYIGPDGFLAQRGYPHKARSSHRSQDAESAQKLWKVSEKLTGVPFDI